MRTSRQGAVMVLSVLALLAACSKPEAPQPAPNTTGGAQVGVIAAPVVRGKAKAQGATTGQMTGQTTAEQGDPAALVSVGPPVVQPLEPEQPAPGEAVLKKKSALGIPDTPPVEGGDAVLIDHSKVGVVIFVRVPADKLKAMQQLVAETRGMTLTNLETFLERPALYIAPFIKYDQHPSPLRETLIAAHIIRGTTPIGVTWHGGAAASQQAFADAAAMLKRYKANPAAFKKANPPRPGNLLADPEAVVVVDATDDEAITLVHLQGVQRQQQVAALREERPEAAIVPLKDFLNAPAEHLKARPDDAFKVTPALANHIARRVKHLVGEPLALTWDGQLTMALKTLPEAAERLKAYRASSARKN